jgi:hypothetical protein
MSEQELEYEEHGEVEQQHEEPEIQNAIEKPKKPKRKSTPAQLEVLKRARDKRAANLKTKREEKVATATDTAPPHTAPGVHKKARKPAKVIYQKPAEDSASSSEEEVIVIQPPKKKRKKRRVVYQAPSDSSDSDYEETYHQPVHLDENPVHAGFSFV